MNKCGIYMILNKINSHVYIGSSVNYDKRKQTHNNSLTKNKHHSLYLQRSWNLYGSDNFLFIFLQETNENELMEIEQLYIDLFKPEYNVSKCSKCPMLGRKHSPETIIKLRNWKRPTGVNNSFYGKKRSPEHIRAAAIPRIGLKRSAETKLKQSLSAKRLNRYSSLKESIELQKRKVIDSNNKIFNSLTETAIFHGISISTVHDILNGRHKQTRKKVSFSYYEVENDKS